MTAAEVMKQLEAMGSEQTRKTWTRHGCKAPMFGVKVGDMKTLVKKIKRDTPLAKELFKTGNGDAQYLAGLIASGAELTRAELQDWAKRAAWSMVSEYTVPWCTAEHPDGWEIALGWIDSGQDVLQACGWNALGSVVGVRPDAELDLDGIKKLLARVKSDIHSSRNRTRYTMNGFVIAVGCFVKPLAREALATARAIGEVEVDVGDTDCKVPLATAYIEQRIKAGKQGQKRNSPKC